MNCETLNSSSSPPNSFNHHPSPPKSSPPQSHFHHPNHLHSMLCSFPTTPNSSAASNWLRRLRSSKGFPDSDQTSLEHFLANSLHQIDPQTHPNSTHPDERLELDGNFTTEIPDDDHGEIQGRDLITNVLSELFHMGECKDLSRIRRKKSCRKQHCPRICVISTNSDAEDVPAQRDSVSLPLPLTLDSSNRHEVGEELKEREHGEEKAEEEERDHVDLSAYSQTEVTVIDTSVPSWKFEKTLFRRKNVWKVGDKEGKGLASGDRIRKKRKVSLNENGGGQKKKLKVCSSSSSKRVDEEEGGQKKKKLKKVCSSSKNVDKEKPTQGNDQAKTNESAYEKKQDNSSHVQEKSFLEKQIDEDSPVILIKSIPTTNKKNVSSIPKSCGKSIKK